MHAARRLWSWLIFDDGRTKMKTFICLLLGLLVLFLSGCISAFSVRVDARPAIDTAVLSQRLSAHYASLGYAPDTLSRPTKEEFTLGRWFSAKRGFIGHAEKNGVLSIWIAPRPQQDDASTVVEDLKKIISEIAPTAVVTAREARSPDLR